MTVSFRGTLAVRVVGLLFCLLLVACGGEDDGTAPPTSQSAISAEPTSTTQAETASPTQAETASTTQAETASPTTLSTTSTAEETTTPRPFQPVLRPDGLGSLDFGVPTAAAMEVLVDAFGQPDPGNEYPYGGHPLRHVYWEDMGLAIVLSDHGFYRDDGEEHLAGWGHGRYLGDLAGWDRNPSSLPLETAEGIGIDSTLADLQSTYGDQVKLEAECDPGGPPTAAYLRGQVSSIRFSFQDLPLEAASRIVSMEAGAGPGC